MGASHQSSCHARGEADEVSGRIPAASQRAAAVAVRLWDVAVRRRNAVRLTLRAGVGVQLRSVRDAIDFYKQPPGGQLRNSNRGSRRTRRAEHSRVDNVHRLEMIHVSQEDRALQHVLQAGTSGSENGRNIPQALLGLRLNIRPRQLVSSRHSSSLTGDEQQPIKCNRR